MTLADQMVVLNRDGFSKSALRKARTQPDDCYFLRQSTDEYLACNLHRYWLSLGDQFFTVLKMFWKNCH